MSLTLLVALAAGGTVRTEPGREGGTFRVALPQVAVTSIDPFIDNLPAMNFVFDATCASLLNSRDKSLPEGRVLVPELAEAFPEVSNGGRTYTFTVDLGHRFSTGARVTARDVVATFRRVLSPTLKSPRAADPDLLSIVGARAFNDGTATSVPGITSRGNRVRFRLSKPAPGFRTTAGTLCILPAGLPLTPEGVRAPVPSAGPYTLSSYVPGNSMVLERNRFYRGSRPRHVDRFQIALVADQTRLVGDVEAGTYDWAWVAGPAMTPHASRLAARYGVNRGRFFIRPGLGLCMLTLNASRPLFRGNPSLRRAVNYALDRRALVREFPPLATVPADQYLQPHQLAFRDAHVYPPTPDIATARRLARGFTRAGKAVFYTRDDPLGRAHGHIVRRNLARIGISVDVTPIATPGLFERLKTPGEPFDIGWICWIGAGPDSLNLHAFFDGRTLGQAEHFNYSHFQSAEVNRRLDAVSRLTGEEFHRAYGQLDVEIARDFAPAVAYAYANELTLVSRRTGCVVLRPGLDLAAVCLK